MAIFDRDSGFQSRNPELSIRILISDSRILQTSYLSKLLTRFSLFCSTKNENERERESYEVQIDESRAILFVNLFTCLSGSCSLYLFFTPRYQVSDRLMLIYDFYAFGILSLSFIFYKLWFLLWMLVQESLITGLFRVLFEFCVCYIIRLIL